MHFETFSTYEYLLTSCVQCWLCTNAVTVPLLRHRVFALVGTKKSHINIVLNRSLFSFVLFVHIMLSICASLFKPCNMDWPANYHNYHKYYFENIEKDTGENGQWSIKKMSIGQNGIEQFFEISFRNYGCNVHEYLQNWLFEYGIEMKIIATDPNESCSICNEFHANEPNPSWFPCWFNYMLGSHCSAYRFGVCTFPGGRMHSYRITINWYPLKERLKKHSHTPTQTHRSVYFLG